MRIAHRYYECSPRIVRAKKKSTITIKPLFDHRKFHDDISYQIALIPMLGVPGTTRQTDFQRTSVTPKDNAITVALDFDAEQEYTLLLEQGDGKVVDEFVLYALNQDLFELRPYKGDTHMHTNYSDGKESPAFVAASCRKIGLDFAAITDHHRYAPSLEAMAAFSDVDIDLRLYPGEEVHPPSNPVHIVNFGGSFSVNDLFKTPCYEEQVAELEKTLTFVPEGPARRIYASCVWSFEKIREAGGLAIFPHPYWVYGYKFDVPEQITDLLFEHQPYDALELIGGFHVWQAESNMLQVARYHEERAKGKTIPIVGATDSHGCEQADLFGWYHTIVFAKSADLNDLIEAIRGLNSVAVEALPNERVRAFGPFRLVCYAQFLLREIFPFHDELCLEEGRLMLNYAAGDKRAAEALSKLKGRVEKLYDKMWGCDS